MRFRSQLHRTVAGFGSLATILALLVGIPLALWLLAGSPIPTGLPSLSELGDALTQNGLSDSALVKIVAGVGWIAWLQITVSILVEAVAWVRGRPAPHMMFAGPIQPFVRKLIATAALLVSSSNASAFASTAAMPARPVAALALPLEHVTVAHTASPITRRDAAAPTSTADMLKTYTVVRYDTLWGLAEQHLGDPMRWREVFDLNQFLPQADGRTLTDPDLIRVGWTLRFPSDAVGLDSAPPGVENAPIAPAPAPRTYPVECPPTSTAVAPAPTSAPTLTLAPTSTAPVAAPRPTTAPVDPASHASTASEHDAPIPWPLVGGGLAAAGLVTLLSRLRRVQQRRRPSGARPRAPHTDLEQIERRMRHVADLDAAEFLDLALRAFTAGAADDKHGPPQILAVRSGSQQVELLLAETPRRPPKGFVATDSDRGWTTDPDLDVTDLRALASGAAAPLPSLVCIGDIDGEQLLIDLETVGVLTVGGSEAESFVNSIALQLATATWIDHVDVVLVTSASTADVTGAARVRRVPNLDAAIDQLRGIGRSFNEALTSSDAASTLHARFSDQHDDGWIPTVLISTSPLSADQLAELRAIVGSGGRGVAVVARFEGEGTWHARVERDLLLLRPLGFQLVPSLVDTDAAQQIDELLTDVAVGDHFESLNEAAPAAPATMPSATYADPPFEVEIRVLGPVEIDGIADSIERRRAEELVAYLALHPKGATDERIKTVLWRDRAPTDGTFNTTVSFARTSLGLDSEGNPHFPRYSAVGHTYRLGPFVTSDLARFEARVAHTKACDQAASIETLRSALELVRGAPLDGARGFEWAYSEHIVAAAEAMIADAAHRLAQLYLAAGDHAGANWAALQGLRACPGDETLYGDRMRACHLAGNLTGVEAAFEELCEIVEALEPYDALHPETLAEYERLRRSIGHGPT